MKYNFKKKILNNGITILFEKRDIPVISVAFAIKQGGINESLSEKGISHFIEHMLYKGTKKRSSRQIAREIEKKGGDLNGFTDEILTAYWCKLPSRHLDIALEVLGDMVRNPLFDEKEIEKERKVIFEEIKMNRDNPINHSFDEAQKLLYTGTIGMSLAGTNETMNSIGREKLLKKFRESYNSDNIILCVVGDADFDKICDFAEKNFENQKREIQHQEFDLKNESKIEKRAGISQANIIFAYHIPTIKDKKSYAAKLLCELLTGGLSSRLFEEIREKRNLAYSIKGVSEITKDYAHTMIYVGTMKEKIDEVKERILEEFKKVSEDFIQEELDEIKEQLIGNYNISMEDSQNQLVNLIHFETISKAEDFYDFEKNIKDVKLEEVKELAKKAIEKHSFFILMPE
jgi:predicted Zn-dependent peptidase